MSGKDTCAVVPEASGRTVEMVTLEIKTLQRQARQMVLGYIIEIGRRLVEVKALLPYGQWGDYLKHEVEYSQSTANNFMRIFEEYGASQQSLFGGEADSQALGNLSYTKALRMLALPAEEREEFAAAHDVESMSTRELEAAIKARDEALKQAEQAKADAKAAEDAWAKMEADMKAANSRLESAQAESGAAAEREAALRAELEALKAAPVEVAVMEVDQSAIDKARSEAVAEMQAKLDKAQADTKEARDKLSKAQDEAKQTEQALSEQLARAKERAGTLEKQLKVSSSKDISAFSVYFEQAKEDFNRLLGCLTKIGRSGAEEEHDKLADALRALLAAMSQQVPVPLVEGGTRDDS